MIAYLLHIFSKLWDLKVVRVPAFILRDDQPKKQHYKISNVIHRHVPPPFRSLGSHSVKIHNVIFVLKAVDTIGNCQRLAFTVGVSQHMHTIITQWKFELNRLSNLRDNSERKKHPCHIKLYAFRWLISRPQVLNLRSRNQIRGKLLSRKLWHFRGSRFSQCFIPSTSPHYSLPSKVLC